MLGKADYSFMCDANFDGKVDIADVNIIINNMLGKFYLTQAK